MEFKITTVDLAVSNPAWAAKAMLEMKTSKQETVNALLQAIKPKLNYISDDEIFTIKLVNGDKGRVMRFKRLRTGTMYKETNENFVNADDSYYGVEIENLDTGIRWTCYQYQTAPKKPMLSGAAEGISSFFNSIGQIYDNTTGDVKKSLENAKGYFNFDKYLD